MRQLLLFLLFFFGGISLFAQIGGQHAYTFLNLTPSARLAALGGNLNAVVDDDPVLFYQNPAALNSAMHHGLTFNTVAYHSGINFGLAGYAQHLQKANITLGAAMQYITYGTFDQTDPAGNVMGEFTAGEYALHLTASSSFAHFRYGAQVKTIYSHFAEYNSYGLALDLAAMYVDSARDWTVSVMMKNAGLQLKPYTPGNNEPLPFDIQVGVSKKLQHLPLRLSVAVHHLHKFDIRYDDPNVQPEQNIFGEDSVVVAEEKSYIVDKIARHFIFNGEFFMGENIRIRLGYNHLRRQELSVADLRSLAGFSIGAGIKISKFRVDYGLANYHLGGASHHFSLSTNLSDF